MQNKRYVICGQVDYDVPNDLQNNILHFHLHGDLDEYKVTLKIADIHRSMYSDIPQRFHDLLEIATYVYCADQAWARGQRDVDTFGGNWRRHFHFVIPVSDLEFWSSDEVGSCLSNVLGFLSDDRYDFEFVQVTDRPEVQGFLSFNEDGALMGFPEQVMMFSGGLDSLGGAVDEIVNNKRRVILVNHRASAKLDRIYQRLSDKLDSRSPECPRPSHVRVTVHKQKWMNKDYMQRSRSFLFASIGASIARMLGHSSVRFYENGVISMNLPIAAQVVGGKATRTTHPRVMAGFERLLSMVADSRFMVETPFIWKTKGEIVELIGKAGCGDMIADSISCTHTWEISTAHPHCGTCSQCLDRRFAISAANMDAHDPLDNYLADVFTQVRSSRNGSQQDEDILLYAGYLERANQARNVSDAVDFLVRFPEAARVIRYLDGSAESVAQKTFDMYRRHSNEVNAVVDRMIGFHSRALRERTLPGNALLRVVYESHLPTSAPAVAGGTDDLPDNIFRRVGDHWQFRFNGRRDFPLVAVNKGAEYIAHLLSQPHQSTPVVELVVGATLEPIETVLGDSGDVADDQAIREYRQKARVLLDAIDMAKQMGNAVRLEELYEELADIERAINEARGLGGRSRKAQSGKERIRKACQAAVRRAMDAVGEMDAELGSHLKQFIRCGLDPVYAPDTELKWETRPLIVD